MLAITILGMPTKSVSVTTESLSTFIFHVNHILRNVVVCKEVGEVYGEVSIKSWLVKNNYKTVFSFSSGQISGVDHTSLSSYDPDVVVGLDPFMGLDLEGVEDTLTALDVARAGLVLAVPNSAHYTSPPALVFTVQECKEVLNQIGRTVVVHHCDQWSLFLVLK